MSSGETTLAHDLKVLQQNAQLADVGFMYIHAEHCEVPEPEPPTFQLEVSIPKQGEIPVDEPMRARIAIRVEVFLPIGKLVAEPFAEFTLDRSHMESLNHASLTALANERVVYDLLPFAREALSDLSSRVFKTQLIIPYFGRGELVFPIPSQGELDGIGKN